MNSWLGFNRSNFSLHIIDGVDHLIRLISIFSKPSSFFECFIPETTAGPSFFLVFVSQLLPSSVAFSSFRLTFVVLLFFSQGLEQIKEIKNKERLVFDTPTLGATGEINQTNNPTGPWRPLLSTSSLIRPSHTIRATIYVNDGSDRTSSMPSSGLHLKVDKGQGLQSGLLVINALIEIPWACKQGIKSKSEAIKCCKEKRNRNYCPS